MRATWGPKAVAVVAASVLLLAACGSDDKSKSSSSSSGGDTTTTADAAPTTAAPSTSAKPTVATATLALGRALVDGDGHTLYVFMKDSGGKSACLGACANLWPPLTATDQPSGDPGVDAAKLSTITRDDGSKQVTYGGKPLYRYSPDSAAGDAKGQGIGGVWFAVSPAGTPITSSAAGGATTTTTAAAVTPGY